MARRRLSVTIRHVAAEAGVSLQTVSRVINNEPNVRDAVILRVKEAIEKLGYVPSIAAQRMAGSRSYLILALNDRDRTIEDWRSRQGTDWVDQMLLGGMLKCAEHGYRLIIELVDTHSDHVEREIMAVLAAVQPDGVILTPPHSDNPTITGLLARQGISFARIGSFETGPGIALTMGDEGAACDATERLIALGHRRIGLIGGLHEYGLSAARLAGWQSAMAAAGLEIEALFEQGDFSFASGERAAETLLALKDPPTAIIASNDQMALAALEVARRRGFVVPDDLSLVSFDNTPVVRFTHPPLTAIDQPIAETTSRAVEQIIKTHGDKDVSDAPIVVKAGWVERGSTAPPPSSRSK
ncbi:MAG: LacI family DNA-binding transcriptional regulator [Chakrabartia sp.]